VDNQASNKRPVGLYAKLPDPFEQTIILYDPARFQNQKIIRIFFLLTEVIRKVRPGIKNIDAIRRDGRRKGARRKVKVSYI
jgi:hypothetical protein